MTRDDRGSAPPLLSEDERPAAVVETPDGAGPLLLVCEHASNAAPAALGDLGLPPEAWRSHIAWDIGALALARRLSRAFDAPLAAARPSRLVYDCNRPPDSPAAIPEQSGGWDIPGNQGLAPAERRRRIDEVYRPFRAAVEEMVGRRLKESRRPALVTVHSYTPVLEGARRSIELGLLHDRDARMADALLPLAEAATGLKTARNQPYGPEDGVTHTLQVDAAPHGLLNVMLEIRNDFLADEAGVARIAAKIEALLRAGLAALAPAA